MKNLMTIVVIHHLPLCVFIVLHSLSLSSFQESQQMLGKLIPEKQLLNDQLKQVQQNSLHSKYIFCKFKCVC